jgi:hypothetical protein
MMKQFSLVVVALMIASASIGAQDPSPPVPGVTGTIGIEGTVDKFYAATHQVAVKTADGVRHLLHLSSLTAVHGTTRTAEGPLGGLERGSQVVVQYVVNVDTKTAVEIDRVGQGGLKVVGGVVTNVDRSAKTLTVRLADDSSMTLRLTDHAAHHVGNDIENQTRVMVYYADDGGEPVAHYFKRASGAR